MSQASAGCRQRYCRLTHQVTRGLGDVLVVVLLLMIVFVAVVVVKVVIVAKTKNKHIKKIRKKKPLTIDRGCGHCCGTVNKIRIEKKTKKKTYF